MKAPNWWLRWWETASAFSIAVPRPAARPRAWQRGLPAAEIVAAELHPHRARLLRKLAPQPNVQVITADALALALRPTTSIACWPMSPAPAPERWRAIRKSNGSSSRKTFIDLQARQIAILRAAMRPRGSRRPAGLFHMLAGTGRERAGNCRVPARRSDFRLSSRSEKSWRGCRNQENWSGRISINWSAEIFCGPFRAFIRAMDSSPRSGKALTTEGTERSGDYYRLETCS